MHAMYKNVDSNYVYAYDEMMGAATAANSKHSFGVMKTT